MGLAPANLKRYANYLIQSLIRNCSSPLIEGHDRNAYAQASVYSPEMAHEPPSESTGSHSVRAPFISIMK